MKDWFCKLLFQLGVRSVAQELNRQLELLEAQQKRKWFLLEEVINQELAKELQARLDARDELLSRKAVRSDRKMVCTMDRGGSS